MRYHLTMVRKGIMKKSQIANAAEGVETRGPSYTDGENVNWYNHYGKLRKRTLELPYDPAISLLGIYPDKTFLQKDTCTPMFIAALIAIDKTWKQPECPLADGWIKNMCMYTHKHTHV